jgi:hypothetical protein
MFSTIFNELNFEFLITEVQKLKKYTWKLLIKTMGLLI